MSSLQSSHRECTQSFESWHFWNLLSVRKFVHARFHWNQSPFVLIVLAVRCVLIHIDAAIAQKDMWREKKKLNTKRPCKRWDMHKDCVDRPIPLYAKHFEMVKASATLAAWCILDLRARNAPVTRRYGIGYTHTRASPEWKNNAIGTSIQCDIRRKQFFFSFANLGRRMCKIHKRAWSRNVGIIIHANQFI